MQNEAGKEPVRRSVWQRIVSSVKAVLPGTTKTCIWVLELTAGISLGVTLLQYLNVLPYISGLLAPAFKYLGLPGSAALSFITGYCVNVYSALAVASTLHLTVRQATILGVMVLCAHNMFIEVPVLKKTGSPAWKMILVRTLSALFLAFAMNLIMPGRTPVGESIVAQMPPHAAFWPTIGAWALSTLKMCVKIVVIIYALNILQKLLKEFGIMEAISKFFFPLLAVFGLPKKTSFLWIVANTVGLAYGSAAMIDEVESGNLTKREVQLVDMHICVSHSNLEDLILMTTIGAVWWILLLVRWIWAIVLVWSLRLEFYLKDIKKKNNFAATNN